MEDNKNMISIESSETVGESSAGTENTGTENQQQQKMFTEEELNERIQKAVQDRLNRERKKYEGFNDIKKEYEELKKFKEEVELQQLSEQEKMQKQFEKLQQERDELLNKYNAMQEQMRQKELQFQFRQLAQQNNIQYVDAALKLADLSDVEIDEEGNFVGLEDVVKNLIEQNPFLVGQQKEKPKPIGEPSNPDVEKPEKTAEQLVKEAEEKYKRTNSPADYVNLVMLKRKYGFYNR
ncbi:phage scaffolding protein [Thermoactinomyces daqus]|uniref:Phage scaffolding protein n=1 Tax=Thermoactinomyces daqus TaxID=1329516 RepID=A0A7W2AHM5_9BACL|nr:phage scaffolding protein [Thermoactinomyces daqus]MBA4542896.1 phage scaffolding protein [Thermoactinomyces daqus]